MRVLLTTPLLDKTGGVANFYLNLREHLGEEVVYFYIGRRGGESGGRAAFRLLADYLRFAWTLARGRFDMTHLNPSLGQRAIWRDAVFLLITKALGKKAIVFMHGWDKAYEKRLRKRGLGLFRFAYFRTDAFLVLAKDFAAGLRTMGYSGPVHLMTTTFDSALLTHSNCYRNRTDAKKPFNILFLSRMERQKGIMETLRAFATVQAQHPSVRLTVAGIGSALEEARRFVSENRIANVEFPGYIRGEQKAQAYRSANCCLFPTTWGEGMPITVVEAMAFGMPVVTRPVGALADFFVDGEMGFITESQDPAVFAELVERLIASPELCGQISRTNREYALSNFAPASVASRIKAIYRDTAAGGGAHERVELHRLRGC
jgi:glycosyltransferase involved in cell wall biosynthesis